MPSVQKVLMLAWTTIEFEMASMMLEARKPENTKQYVFDQSPRDIPENSIPPNGQFQAIYMDIRSLCCALFNAGRP